MEEQRKKESKLENALAFATSFSLAGIFEYNFYRVIDKLGYFKMNFSSPEFLDVMNNASIANGIGICASLIGGFQLGSYFGRKIKKDGG